MTPHLGKKAARSSLAHVVMNGWGLVAGLILTPFIIHSIGDVHNGYWVLVRTLLGYYGFLDLGISASISRFVAVAIGRKDEEDTQNIVKTGLGFILIVDLLFFLLMLIACSCVGRFMVKGDPDLIRSLLVVMSAGIIVTLPGRVFSGVIVANVRQDIIAWIEILKTTLRAGCFFFFLSSGYGVLTLAMISAGVMLFSSVMHICAAKYLMPEIHMWPPGLNRNTFKRLIRYGLSITSAAVSDIVRWSAAPLAAGIISGAAFVTHFNLALSLSRYGLLCTSGIFMVLMPVFGQLIGATDDERVKRVFYRALNFTTLFSVMVYGGLIAIGYEFIGQWMGEDYTDAYIALAFMSAGLMVASMQNPVITLMQGKGLARPYAVTNGIEAVLNVLLCFLLGRYGMVGFGIAFAAPMLLVKLSLQPFVILSRMNWSLTEYYLRLLTRFALCLVAFLIATLASRAVANDASGWLKVLAKGGVYTTCYCLFALIVIVKEEERQSILEVACPASVKKILVRFRLMK